MAGESSSMKSMLFSKKKKKQCERVKRFRVKTEKTGLHQGSIVEGTFNENIKLKYFVIRIGSKSHAFCHFL